MGRNNADFQANSGKFYGGIKGLGRQVHIHTEPDPENRRPTSLCGKPLDCDLTGSDGKANPVVLHHTEYPGNDDPFWNTHNSVMEATCTPCIKAARTMRGY